MSSVEINNSKLIFTEKNNYLPDNLFIFELANNHMGDLDHGLKIIEIFSKISKSYPFNFAFKLQYRELDSFIHSNFKDRMDIKSIKRFSETRLSRNQTKKLVDAIKSYGLLSMCTPFDEPSVDQIIDDGFDILKIASCSFTDWPLLEKIGSVNLPIIGSTAGIKLIDIDNVVTFFKNRDKKLALETCVAEYPTEVDNLQLNQIDLLINRYEGIRIGYSTHENPEETLPVSIAIGKGASIFEKHVGIATEAYPLNNYSANPEQVINWLNTAAKAYKICGAKGFRVEATENETKSLLSLRRGVYAKRFIKKDELLTNDDVFFAIPTHDDHLTANDWSKYIQYYANEDIQKDEPIFFNNTYNLNYRDNVYNIVKRVKTLLKDSGAVIPGEATLEISHHYGIERFDEFGITMVTVINRHYCKKLIVVLPGQKHPEQYHKLKEETFHILYGDLVLNLNGVSTLLKTGNVVTIEPGIKHYFESEHGAVFEEISTKHYQDDSYYSDSKIGENKNRKTYLTYWLS
jgi:sialic acid synthase SpsE/quercetin dioxygenase-like cupin family protein